MSQLTDEQTKPEASDLVPVNPATLFDTSRSVFLATTSEMLHAPEMSPRHKTTEIESTIRALRQIARMEGLPINA
jgi:hypothetical protein